MRISSAEPSGNATILPKKIGPTRFCSAGKCVFATTSTAADKSCGSENDAPPSVSSSRSVCPSRTEYQAGSGAAEQIIAARASSRGVNAAMWTSAPVCRHATAYSGGKCRSSSTRFDLSGVCRQSRAYRQDEEKGDRRLPIRPIRRNKDIPLPPFFSGGS